MAYSQSFGAFQSWSSLQPQLAVEFRPALHISYERILASDVMLGCRDRTTTASTNQPSLAIASLSYFTASRSTSALAITASIISSAFPESVSGSSRLPSPSPMMKPI